MSWSVIQGDARALPLADASVDAVVCDPPYDLGFMGKSWDRLDSDFNLSWAREALRVLKPGGHLLAFGGTRTYHRMVCAVEDAGFDIRDMIAWHYGSGFPKSKNLDGEWQGWGTALKPATEPIVLARKPLIGSVAANVTAHGTGALNVDGCRIETDDIIENHGRAPTENGWDPRMSGGQQRGQSQGQKLGRWPTNLLLTHSPDCTESCAQGCPVAELDAQSGERPGMASGGSHRPEYAGGMFGKIDAPHLVRGDTGGASRFFPAFRYCPKPDRAERNVGLEGARQRNVNDGRATSIDNPYQRGDTLRRNTHPTVKPVALMQWLCRLVTPPKGLVLDPFTGSGTTGMAALREGFAFVGIEREVEYVQIARARIIGDAPLLNTPQDDEPAVVDVGELP